VSHVDVDLPMSLAGYLDGAHCAYCGMGGHSTHEHALGQAVAADARAQIVQAGILVLAKANEAAKRVAANAIANSTLLARPRTTEWARTFTATVEGMVVRLLTVGKDGTYAWEKTPALITTVADFVEAEAKEMQDMQADLLAIGAGLRQAAEAVARKSVEIAAAAAAGAAKGFPPGTGGVPLMLIGVGVALVAAAYVFRSFK